ncbi:hypothetical protein PSPO01_05666 [Paraphaeosphaeria sporulosa]
MGVTAQREDSRAGRTALAEEWDAEGLRGRWTVVMKPEPEGFGIGSLDWSGDWVKAPIASVLHEPAEPAEPAQKAASPHLDPHPVEVTCRATESSCGEPGASDGLGICSTQHLGSPCKYTCADENVHATQRKADATSFAPARARALSRTSGSLSAFATAFEGYQTPCPAFYRRSRGDDAPDRCDDVLSDWEEALSAVRSSNQGPHSAGGEALVCRPAVTRPVHSSAVGAVLALCCLRSERAFNAAHNASCTQSQNPAAIIAVSQHH